MTLEQLANDISASADAKLRLPSRQPRLKRKQF